LSPVQEQQAVSSTWCGATESHVFQPLDSISSRHAFRKSQNTCFHNKFGPKKNNGKATTLHVKNMVAGKFINNTGEKRGEDKIKDKTK
jgi:hypothetical protein